MDYENMPGTGRDSSGAGDAGSDQARMAPEIAPGFVPGIAAAAAAGLPANAVTLLPNAEGFIVLPPGVTLDDLEVVGRDLVVTAPDGQVYVILEGAIVMPRIVAAGGPVPLLANGEGLIVLPPGVSLDDLRVDGRDLVFTAPDGRVFVIADGAIYVPQIVIDGVAVPPSNFAALLVGEGSIGNDRPIEPGAGSARSSGGNFFEAAGSIQGAFDLGDLLPPTAFDLAAEPNLEVIPQPLDRDPTLAIVTVNQPVGATDATANVAESGLPARAGEPAGSNAAANTEATSGTIVFNSPDGIASLTINGVALTGAGQTFTSPRGTLTITSFDTVAGTANFTYTLTDNLVGGTVADQFTVILTDPDGDAATSTLTINLADDAPTARNDTDAVAASTFTAQTGNVITAAGTTSGAAGADTLGADNATITRIASNAIAANADTTFEAGVLQVAGQYGTVRIAADGSYSYTRAAGTPGGVSDAFTYTLTDADGSASTATLTISIGDAAPAITSLPVAGSASTIVAESGLPARGGEAPGSNAPAPTETTSGTITFTGGDGPATATINGVTVAVGAVVTIPGVGALTVTGFDPVAGTITYSFTLADNTAGDTTSATFNLVVTDLDGDTAPGTFTIAITDDVPLAVDDSATQGSENAAVTVNVLGNDIQGADSVALSAVAAVPGTLSGTGALVYNNDGSFTYTPGAGEEGTVTFDYTITDGDGDTSRATVTITLLADSTPTVSVAGDNTVSEAALPARGEEPAGSNAASPDETATGTIPVTTGGDTLASLVINGVNVTTGGTVTTAKGVLTVALAEGGYSYSYTLSDNTLADPDSDTFAIVVTDSDGDTASTSLVVAIADDNPTARDDAGSVAAGTYGPISGSVTANDTPGADGIVVLSYAAGDTSGNAGTTIQGQYGTLSISATGTYSYTRAAGTPGGVSDSFAYTVRDGDGDTATANLVIAIADSGTTLTLPIAGTPGSTQVLEAGLPAGSAAATDGEFASGSFSFTAPDGPATVTIGGAVVTTVGQTIAGSFGTLTITSIAAGSIGYTYQLTTNTAGDTTSDNFAVTVTDQDGDNSGGMLTIAIVDDVPTARADSDSVSEDGPTIATGNVVTAIDQGEGDANMTDGVADTRGADGATVTAVAFLPVGGDATSGTVSTGLAGAYGTLTLGATGGYSYALNNANPLVQGLDGNDTLTETFRYTLTDGDGDVLTTTLTVTINGSNDPVTITGLNFKGGEETVLEANLADGSNPVPAALTQTGTFSVAGVDGIATITVGGLTVFSGGTVTTGQTFNAAFGTLTITAVTPVTDAAGDTVSATIAYSYTLNDNTLTHSAAGSDSITDSFAVTVTDSDGSTAMDSLDVVVVDDVPTARADIDSATEDTALVADGNVITASGGTDANMTDGVADTRGADGAVVSAVSFGATAGTVGEALAGTYGTLTLNATGGYSYTLNNANPLVQGLDSNDTLTEVFAYTLRDGDGDTSPSTLTITINGSDDGVTITGLNVEGGEERVFEANLADGSSPAAAALTQTGTFSVAGVDGIATITVGGLTVFSGGTVTTGQTFNAAFGTLTITGVTPVTDASGDTVSATIAYSYTLGDNTLTHSVAGSDTITDSFAVTVTDSDGSTAMDSLDVVVVDDVPMANADSDSATEDTALVADGNVITASGGTDANMTDGVADTRGADGAVVSAVSFGATAGTVGEGLAGTYGTLTLNATGDYSYALNNANPLVQGLDGNDTLTETFRYTLTDGDGDVSTTTLTVTINGSNDPVTITGLNIAGGEETVLEANLADGSSPAAAALTQTGMFSVAGVDGIATITVGGLTVFAGGTVTTGQTFNAAFGTLTITGVTPVTDASGDTVSATIAYSYTLNDNTLTHSVAGSDTITDSFAVTVTDSDGSVANASLDVVVVDDVPMANADTNMVDEGAQVGGNVLSDGTDDVFGADGAATTMPAGGVVGVAAGSNTAVAATGAPGTPIETALGTLTLNANGSYTYQAKPNTIIADTTDSFTYTIRDSDGDVSTTTLIIAVKAVNGMVADTDVDVDESGLDGIGSQAAPNGEFDTNGQITVTGATGTFTYTLTGSPATPFGTLTLDAATGAYSYTLTRTVDNATANDGAQVIPAVESFGYQVTDQNGNLIGTGAILVNVKDDIPTARADTAIMVAEDGANVGGMLLANDTQGADRASVTAVTIGGNTTAVAAMGTTTVTTAAGVYTFTAEGTWTFDPALNQSNNTAPVDAGFTYTITDGDGDQSSAAQAISVIDGANPMAGTPITLTVDDQNLANGSTPATPVTDADTITFTPGSDVIASIVFDTVLTTLNSTNLTWARVSDTQITGTDTGSLLLVVTLDLVVTGDTATVTATLSNNFDAHPQFTADDLAQLGFVNVVATDSDGDFVTTAVNVEVSDDVPTARADTALSVVESAGATAGVNLLANDTRGADGAAVTHVDLGAGFVAITSGTAVAGGFAFTVAGKGTYVFNADGSWSFDPVPVVNPANAAVDASFSYRITDGDGDVSQAAQTVSITDGADPMAGTAITLTVDDQNLANGSTPAVPVTDADTITFATGSDVIASIVFDTVLTTLNSTNLTWLRVSDTQITGTDTGSLLLVVTLDLVVTGDTATVTATLSNNFDAHPQFTADDLAQLGFVNVVATDSDGDFVTTAVNVEVSDDVPTAADDTNIVQGAENTAFTIAALANDTFGADGVATGDATKVFVVSQATYGVVSYDPMTGLFTYTPNAGAGSDGNLSDSFTYRIVDGDGDVSTATVSITLQPDSTPMLNAITNLAVDEDGFPSANADNGQVNPTETTGTNSLTDLTGSAVFAFGNDVPTTLVGSAVLVDDPLLDGQLVTLDNQNVVFAIEAGGALVGRAGNAMGVEVIRITLTGATAGPGAGEVTYTYSTTLAQPVRHTMAGTEDTDTLSGVTIRVTDRDGDMTTGSFDVAVRDDVPSLDVAQGDETAASLTTRDAFTDGTPTDSDVAMTTAAFAGVFSLTSVAGADGANTPVLNYALDVTSAMSGLSSADNTISLYKLMDGTIVGSTSATNPGSVDATVVFSLTVASDGVVTLTQFQQIDHAIEATTDAPFADQFASLADGLITLTASSSITDGDGDVASDMEVVNIGANIQFADDGPTLTNVATGGSVSIDETAAGANFLAPIMATSMAAVISATSAFGADGMAATGATVYGLTISGGGMTPLATAIGDFPISLVQTSPNTITGQYTDGTVKTAFTLVIGTDGKLTVTQNVALEHNLDGNTAAAYDDALDLAGLVNATITLTDFDGDTAFESRAIGANIVFRDDGVDAVLDTGMVPAGTNGPVMGSVTGNDYRGADGSFVTSVTGSMGPVTIAAMGSTVVQGSFGVLTISADGTYSYARTPGLGGGSDDVFTYTLTDNDGDFDTATLTITINDLTPVATTASAAVDDEGLLGGILGGTGDIDANAGDGDLTSEAIFTGTLGGTLGDGTNTFLFGSALTGTTQVMGQETVTYAVSVGGSLLIAMITASPDAARLNTELYRVQITDQTTGAYTLTLMDNVLHPNANLENDVDITVAYQLRDQDLDLSTAGVLSIKFDDDIPTAEAISAGQTTENVAFDIPLAGQFAAGADGLAATGGITFTSGAQGTATLNGTTLTYTPIVGAGSPPLGTSDSFTYTITDADGDAVTRTVSVTLQPDSVPIVVNVTAAVDDEGLGGGIAGGTGDIDANLGDLDGAMSSEASFSGQITVNFGNDSGTVSFANLHNTMGMVGTETVTYTWNAMTNVLTATGPRGVLFTVSLSPTGAYTVTLMDNVLHAAGGNNETSAPVVDLFYRATDNENDTVETGKLSIAFNDDTPTNFMPAPAMAINTGTAQILNQPLDTVDNLAVAGTGIFDNAGADGIASIAFAASLHGTRLTGDSGVLQSGGNDIFLYIQANGSLIASTDTTPVALDPLLTVFTATLNATTGTYSIDFDRTIDNGSGVQAADFSATAAGNTPWKGVDPDLLNGATLDIASPLDPNPDSTDLLFTPIGGGAQNTINSDSDDIGIGTGQTVDTPEALRIDLVQDLRRDPLKSESDADGYLYDTHSGVSQFTFSLIQVNGNAAQTSVVRIRAYNVNDADPLSQSNVGATAINTEVNLDPSTVTVLKAAGNLAVVTIYEDGNSLVISGLQEGDDITFGAVNDATFEAVVIENANGDTFDPAPAGGGNVTVSGNDFSLGGFAFSFVAIGDPVQFSLPVVLTDGDGDTSTGSILVSLDPVTPVVLDLDGDGVEFSALGAGAAFDYNGDGNLVATAWAGKDDGILALDANGNGSVDNGSEIVFGNGGLTDLEGLAAKHDSNHDGVLDANDADFAKFGVWQDADGDGTGDAGEFSTLAELGIASIALVSDGQAYTAAGGDVTVAGSSTYTRADGTTGTVADAAFATAPLDKMAAKTAELAATNVAAAGVLAAAAAAVAALPAAAAEPSPATADATDAPAALALEAVPETHETLRETGDPLTTPVAVERAPDTASHGDDAPATAASNLSAPADHAAASPALAVVAEHAAAFDSPFAAGGFAGDAGQLMDALLAAAQAANAGISPEGQHAQDLAAVQEAFGDSHGAALVDAVVDHFAGAEAAAATGGPDALASLFAASVAGGETFGPAFDLNQMLSDMSAHAAAQV